MRHYIALCVFDMLSARLVRFLWRSSLSPENNEFGRCRGSVEFTMKYSVVSRSYRYLKTVCDESIGLCSNIIAQCYSIG